MEKAISAPVYEKGGWVKYKEVYFHLVDEKHFPKKDAVKFIAEEEGLNEEEHERLYNASKRWKREGE